MAKITVQDTEITVVAYNDNDYISLTDMANAKNSESRAADIIKNWMRNRYTIEFLGTWEMIHNPNEGVSKPTHPLFISFPPFPDIVFFYAAIFRVV